MALIDGNDKLGGEGVAVEIDETEIGGKSKQMGLAYW